MAFQANRDWPYEDLSSFSQFGVPQIAFPNLRQIIYVDEEDEELAKALQASLQVEAPNKKTENEAVQRKMFDEELAYMLQEEQFDSTSDAELARMLQEEENKDLSNHFSEVSNEAIPPNPFEEDDYFADNLHEENPEVDLDSMTYEQILALGDTIGVVEKGLSVIDLSSLPTTVHKISKGKSKEPESTSCLICQDEFKTNDQKRFLPCFHSFHVNCIDTWLSEKLTCPICLKEVKPSS